MLDFPNETSELVWIDRCTLFGSTYYWYRYKSIGITKAGVVDGNVLVHKKIVPFLVFAQKMLMREGYGICIKKGWRPEASHEVIHQKRVELKSKKEAKSVFNMNDMFPSSGESIDVVLWDFGTGTEVQMRDYDDGVPAYFFGFYKDRKDEKAVEYHRLQTLLRNIMFEVGFEFGIKREYFHFNFKKYSF